MDTVDLYLRIAAVIADAYNEHPFNRLSTQSVQDFPEFFFLITVAKND